MVGIYKITNLINNKVYIGQSKNIEMRWNRHKTGPFNPNNNSYNSALYRAIRKYRLENFTFEVIEKCEEKDLNEKEIFWIRYYDSHNKNKGYNLTGGGENAITVSKITIEQAHEIKQLLINSCLSQADIAEKYGISQKSVSNINIGQTWLEENCTYPLRKNIPLLNNKDKKDNFCIDCGVVISPKAKRCLSCAGKINRKVKRATREELKTLIRTTPFITIGKMFNVSDNTVRKWCKSYNLPSKSREIKQYSDKEWSRI